jgi:hypothetical protein
LVSFLQSYIIIHYGGAKVTFDTLGCGGHCLVPSSSSEDWKELLDVIQWMKAEFEKTRLNLRREIGSGNAALQKMLLEHLA